MRPPHGSGSLQVPLRLETGRFGGDARSVFTPAPGFGEMSTPGSGGGGPYGNSGGSVGSTVSALPAAAARPRSLRSARHTASISASTATTENSETSSHFLAERRTPGRSFAA